LFSLHKVRYDLGVSARPFGGIVPSIRGSDSCTRVVPIEEVEPCALELAQIVANYSSNALRSGLGFVQAVHGQPWKAAASAGRLLRYEFFKSAEFQADLTTFLNRASSSAAASRRR
jgi:hypothetical protein